MKATLMFLGAFVAVFGITGYLSNKDPMWITWTWIGIGIEWIGFLFCED